MTDADALDAAVPTTMTLEEWADLPEDVEGEWVDALGAPGGTVSPPGCDGLSLDLDELWQEIERLGPEEPESPEDG